MKKIISCVLLFVFIFGICSCAGSQNEEFLLDLNGINSDSSKIDLDGYECEIVQGFGMDTPFFYPLDTLMSDMVLQRMANIGKEMNCNITLSSDATGSYLDGTIAKILGGTHVAEIGYTHQPSRVVRAGCFYPLDALRDYIDYMNADKFGSLGLLEIGMMNGVPYTVAPVSWPGKQMSYSYNIFAVNEDLISRYGKVDPRDYVENGEWTYDTFENVISDYQIEDGEFKATAVNFTWSIVELCMTNGASFISVNEDGTAFPSLDSPAIGESIDWFGRLYKNNSDCITTLGHYEMLPVFLAGELVMTQTSFSNVIADISYDMDNFGVVPMPCGPRGEYGTWPSVFSDFDSFAVFVNAKEPEAAAMVVDRMCDPFEGYETLEDIKNYASDIFFDKRDVDFFTYYLKNIRWNYWTLGIYSFFDTAKNEAIKGASSIEIFDRYADAANALVEEYVVPNYQFIKEYEEYTGTK
ncbi:MAG: extracellular solute-binding protein [Clostridia bacterium]|nr:extracellular solute-binding protein [Clostridia bacterium]